MICKRRVRSSSVPHRRAETITSVDVRQSNTQLPTYATSSSLRWRLLECEKTIQTLQEDAEGRKEYVNCLSKDVSALTTNNVDLRKEVEKLSQQLQTEKDLVIFEVTESRREMRAMKEKMALTSRLYEQETQEVRRLQQHISAAQTSSCAQCCKLMKDLEHGATQSTSTYLIPNDEKDNNQSCGYPNIDVKLKETPIPLSPQKSVVQVPNLWPPRSSPPRRFKNSASTKHHRNSSTNSEIGADEDSVALGRDEGVVCCVHEIELEHSVAKVEELELLIASMDQEVIDVHQENDRLSACVQSLKEQLAVANAPQRYARGAQDLIELTSRLKAGANQNIETTDNANGWDLDSKVASQLTQVITKAVKGVLETARTNEERIGLGATNPLYIEVKRLKKELEVKGDIEVGLREELQDKKERIREMAISMERSAASIREERTNLWCQLLAMEGARAAACFELSTTLETLCACRGELAALKVRVGRVVRRHSTFCAPGDLGVETLQGSLHGEEKRAASMPSSQDKKKLQVQVEDHSYKGAGEHSAERAADHSRRKSEPPLSPNSKLLYHLLGPITAPVTPY